MFIAGFAGAYELSTVARTPVGFVAESKPLVEANSRVTRRSEPSLGLVFCLLLAC